jgi:tetratricopeptide (TPR) repeat protein
MVNAASGPAGIFISYRRDDAAYPAGWLFDRLAAHFGAGRVFKDVDSIQFGDDFPAAITSALESCAVLVAVIGARWLTAAGERGRRLDDPGDYVRLELEAAFRRGVRVIPVLVDGARMPRAAELPAGLAELSRRQAAEVSPASFNADTGRLLRALEAALAQAASLDAVSSAGRGPLGGEGGPVADGNVRARAVEVPEGPVLPPGSPRPGAGAGADAAVTSSAAVDPGNVEARRAAAGPGREAAEQVSGRLRAAAELLGHADALLARRRLPEAAAAYREALVLDAGSASAHAGLSIALSGQRESAEAEAESHQALAADPDCALARVSLGLVLASQGQYLEAEVVYREAVRLSPESSAAYRCLGEALLFQGRWDDASAAFGKAIEIEPGDVAARLGLGITQEETGRLADARKAFSRVIRIEPGNADAHYHLGRVLQRNGSRRAERAYRDAVRYDLTHAAAYQALGICALWKEQWAEAEHAFREAIHHDPESAAAGQYLAAVLTEQGKLQEAVDVLRNVLASAPSTPSARIQLGYLLCQLGEKAEAEAICESMRIQDLPRASTRAYLAGLLEGLGRNTAAEVAYREAIRLNPRDYETHLFLWHLLKGVNRKKEARAEKQVFRRTRKTAKQVDRRLVSTAAAAAMEGLPQVSGGTPEAAWVLIRVQRSDEIWAYSGDQLSAAGRRLSILIYLLPILNLSGLFYGVRAVRVNVIQALVLDIGIAVAVIATIFSSPSQPGYGLWLALAIVAYTITVPGLLYCLIRTATRRPPRIPAITLIATRIVYGSEQRKLATPGYSEAPS